MQSFSSYSVTMVEYGSFRDLIWALIYSRNLKDDLEKLRYSAHSISAL